MGRAPIVRACLEPHCRKPGTHAWRRCAVHYKRERRLRERQRRGQSLPKAKGPTFDLSKLGAIGWRA